MAKSKFLILVFTVFSACCMLQYRIVSIGVRWRYGTVTGRSYSKEETTPLSNFQTYWNNSKASKVFDGPRLYNIHVRALVFGALYQALYHWYFQILKTRWQKDNVDKTVSDACAMVQIKMAATKDLKNELADLIKRKITLTVNVDIHTLYQLLILATIIGEGYSVTCLWMDKGQANSWSFASERCQQSTALTLSLLSKLILSTFINSYTNSSL